MNKEIILVSLIALMVISVGLLSGCTEEQNKFPTVEIFTDPMNGYQPLYVSFTINAEDTDGLVQSCRINFGDGTTPFDMDLNEMSLNHTYHKGIYVVVVTVIDDKGAVIKENITIIVYNKLPTSLPTSSPTNGTAPLTVFFNGSGTDDMDIISYHWDFGNGDTSNEQNPIYTFEESGIFIVTLTVTDNDGGTNSETIWITSISNRSPVASASSDKTTAFKSLTVHFTGSGIDHDGSIISYYWDFGDGSTSNEQNPTHTFYHDGEDYMCTYYARLTVTDDRGATDDDLEIITLTGLKMTVTSSYFSYYYNRMNYDIKVETCFDVDTNGCYKLKTSKVGEEYETCTHTVDKPDTISAGNSASWTVVFHTTRELAGWKLIWEKSFGDIEDYVY